MESSLNYTMFEFGYVDPTQKFLWIPIYKNAHTKIREELQSYGWTMVRETNMPNFDHFFQQSIKFAVLRNPYERWVNGFVTFIEKYKKDDPNDKVIYELLNSDKSLEILQIIFSFCNNFNFDEHTRLQKDFFSIDNKIINEINFFYLNDNLGYQINKWFQSHGVINKFNNHKINQTDKKSILYKNLINFLFDYQYNRYKEKLYQYLQPDYDFIDSINFYAR